MPQDSPAKKRVDTLKRDVNPLSRQHWVPSTERRANTRLGLDIVMHRVGACPAERVAGDADDNLDHCNYITAVVLIII